MGVNNLKKSILDKNKFSVTWELVPGRGAKEDNIDKIFTRAQAAATDKLVDGISITDNPGGNPAISAEYLGIKLKELGIEPLVHFTCKDKNRNQIESRLYALERADVSNLLILSGDYPVSGYKGRAKPVFDYDSVQLINLISDLNQGLKYKDNFNRTKTLKQSNFFQGACVSPFKRLEIEQLLQYYKLKNKIEAGAQFIITQLGYDLRKFEELIKVCQLNNWQVPLIANLYLLTYGPASAMNKNLVPGCVVTDKLLREISEEKKAVDKGKKGSLLRAAKMYACLKGIGYDGVHLGGHGLEYEDIEYIITEGEKLTANYSDYLLEFSYPQKDGFYLFTKDEETKLNTDTLTEKNEQGKKDLHNSSFRFFHQLIFAKKGLFYKPFKQICKKIDASIFEKPFTASERIIKTLSNNCQECGDCALLDLAYLCPMSQCPKNMRNGPCGGSKDGFCEVYPGKKNCLYYRVYKRLKPYGEEKQLAENYIPPVNWDLNHTSSWLNYFLEKDHSALT